MEIPYSSINNIQRFLHAKRYSRVYTSNPDPIIYPKYYQAKRFEIVLNEGDSIYIPYGWFHKVYSERVNEDTNINLAINFWSYSSSKTPLNILTNDYTNSSVKYINNVTKEIYKEHYELNQPFTTSIQIPSTSQIYQTLSNCSFIVDSCSNSMFIPDHFGMNYTDRDTVTFDEFMKLKNIPNRYYYIVQNNIHCIRNSELVKNIKPKYILDDSTQINFWINFGNVSCIPHVDEYDNILCQLQGAKRIFLFPPSERDNLYLYNPFNIDLVYSIEKLHKLSVNKVVDINDVYIQYFKKTLPSHICDHIIQLLKDKHIYETRLLDIDAKMDSIFFDTLKQTLELYNKTLINHKNIFPYTSFNDTGYIIRCYNFNKQLNPLHFSGYNNIPKNAFLKYIWFLNDHPNPTYINNRPYEALAGSLLIYPIHFTYLECEDPIIENKYICYGYLCNI
jgi:hypothetical protein